MDVIRLSALAVALGTSGCMLFMTKEDGQKLQDEVAQLKKKSNDFDLQAGELRKATEQAKADLENLRGTISEANRMVSTATRTSANLGQDVDKLKADLAAAGGRIDNVEGTLTGLSKSFNDFRAASDTKLEQLTNATTTAKTPPIPESPEAVYNEARKYFDAKNWKDARRLLDAFIARYPTDQRAPSAQYLKGESYLAEGKYANAIGEYAKVIDNYPKSESVPDAMYKNGTAFYSLKYCSDAKVYFQELLRRYPKTTWKKEAGDQLKKLQKDIKDKAVCQS
jgi:tol-pal system protein YbgF